MKLLSNIFRGISIYGLETQIRNYVCFWEHPLEYYMKELKQLEFNAIRVPFSKDYVDAGNFTLMDQVFNLSVNNGFEITLDWHRTLEEHQSYSPISEVSIEDFLSTWYILMDRYILYPNVTISIFNEYQGTDSDWYNSLLKTILLNMEGRYPNHYRYICGCVEWSGNCHDMDFSDLPFHERISYGLHKYYFSSDKPFTTDWDYSIGSFPQKVILEEWGFKMILEQIEWAEQFIEYLKEKNITNNFFWTLSHSSDTDGLYLEDCTTINWTKYSIIKKLWS